MQPKYYIVGGYVRDLLLNVKSKDVDFCCECDSYADMRADLISKGVEIFLENEKFLTIRARHPKFGGVDYVCCREETGYADGRRPDEVRIGTLLSDLSRRDFCANAVAMTEDGEFIDPFGGIEDVKNKILRCVGNTNERFNEDSLRLLRGIRFFITKGFSLHEDIQFALTDKELVNKLKNISRERIYEELRKCFDFDTKKTLDFFREFSYLEQVIFGECGIKLEPKI